MADKQSSSHYRFASSVLLISFLSLSWAASFSKANLYHDHLDYSRNASRVNPIVQDSTRCRSDWADAAVDMLEGQQAKIGLLDEYGAIDPLSQQMLIDCLKIKCGQKIEYPHRIFDYVYVNGIALDSSYGPESSEQCDEKPNQMIRTFVPKSYYRDELKGEYLKQMLRSFGPIMVGVDRQVLNGTAIATCRNTGRVNHYVTLVGYGKGAQGKNYFKYKNSLGEDWGDKGYGRIEREKGCKQFGVLLVLERVL